jgi:hypothetical protein
LKLVLAADIPLDDEAENVADWISLACDELLHASRELSQSDTLVVDDDGELETPEGNPADPDWVAGVKQLFEELNWPFTERDGGRLCASLDVSGGRSQAIVEPAGFEGVHLACPLPSVAGASASGQLAVSLFLLAACRVVRMVRVAAAVSGETIHYCWETWLGDEPTARQLGQALSSLSIACRLTDREIPVLAEDSVARRYLAARGWSVCVPSVNRNSKRRRVKR